MNEPTVTIKMTRTELNTLIESLDLCIHELPQHEDDDDKKTPARITLFKQLRDIEERLDEKIREAVNDQRISKESSNGQTKGQSSEGVCVPCDD